MCWEFQSLLWFCVEGQSPNETNTTLCYITYCHGKSVSDLNNIRQHTQLGKGFAEQYGFTNKETREFSLTNIYHNILE